MPGEYKNARYARERAATCRYYARKLGKARFEPRPKEVHLLRGGG